MTEDLYFGDELRRRLSDRLARFTSRQLRLHDLRAASVVLLLVGLDDGRAGLVVTRRAARPGSHSGQWALPGGRVEPEESAVQAGLRELEEEIGVRASQDEVLGTLDDYPTRSGYVITPLVVWGGHDPVLRPDPREVASVHITPLDELRHEPRFITIPESDRPVIQMPLFDSLIHAPTAAVLFQLREVALFDRATRVAHLEQPVFAWS